MKRKERSRKPGKQADICHFRFQKRNIRKSNNKKKGLYRSIECTSLDIRRGVTWVCFSWLYVLIYHSEVSIW
jgi:hypothetical protein